MDTVEIKTSLGIVKGIRSYDSDIFLGIPYAKPPVGKRRWREPQMTEPWQATLDATRFPNKCIQGELSEIPLYGKEFYDDSSYNPPSSEDCLYLNIWKPHNIPTSGSPIVVWIHGGAFEQGHSCEKEFDGEGYAKRGIVFVSVNYRLGPFGFLAIPERFSEDCCTGNYGLLDQLMALKFIKKYISEFGGNPNKITIMGQSAGSFSAQALWASPLGNGLFHQAILLSGVGSWEDFPVEHRLEDAYVVTGRLMRYLNIKTIEELESVPGQQIMDAYLHIRSGWNTLLFGPTVDGYVLQESVVKLFKSGAVRPLPSIMGATSEDILWELPSKSGKGRVFDQVLLITDFLRLNSKPVPYIYYFSHKLPGSADGAFHSSELWYVFGTLKRSWRQWTDSDFALAEQMQDYLAKFIKTGVPDISAWERDKIYTFS